MELSSYAPIAYRIWFLTTHWEHSLQVQRDAISFYLIEVFFQTPSLDSRDSQYFIIDLC